MERSSLKRRGFLTKFIKFLTFGNSTVYFLSSINQRQFGSLTAGAKTAPYHYGCTQSWGNSKRCYSQTNGQVTDSANNVGECINRLNSNHPIGSSVPQGIIDSGAEPSGTPPGWSCPNGDIYLRQRLR